MEAPRNRFCRESRQHLPRFRYSVYRSITGYFEPNHVDFGDGKLDSNVKSPMHFYDTSGTIKVTLTGTTAIHGCPNSLSKTVVIFPSPKDSIVISPQEGCQPLISTLTDFSVNGNIFFGISAIVLDQVVKIQVINISVTVLLS